MHMHRLEGWGQSQYQSYQERYNSQFYAQVSESTLQGFFKEQESINSGHHYVNNIGILISGHHCVELHIDVAEEQPWDVRSPADKAGAHARLARWQLRSISVYQYKRPNSILHE